MNSYPLEVQPLNAIQHLAHSNNSLHSVFDLWMWWVGICAQLIVVDTCKFQMLFDRIVHCFLFTSTFVVLKWRNEKIYTYIVPLATVILRLMRTWFGFDLLPYCLNACRTDTAFCWRLQTVPPSSITDMLVSLPLEKTKKKELFKWRR